MLVWTDNYIESDGARMIGEALKTNTTLTVLNLESAIILLMHAIVMNMINCSNDG